MSLFTHNLNLLQVHYPHLLEEITKAQPLYQSQIEITPKGFPTLKVYYQGRWSYLHSRYDPLTEARRWAEANVTGVKGEALLYGAGLGYHVQELLKLAVKLKKITILQLGVDLFRTALGAISWEDIITDPRVELVVTNEITELTAIMSRRLRDGHSLLLYRPAVTVIPDWASSLREALLSFGVRQNTNQRFKELVQHNLRIWAEQGWDSLPDISLFQNTFQGLPMILVAAGPSLKMSLPELVGLESRALIMTVGTAAKPLLSAGIRPHFIIVLDPQEIVWRQIENIEGIPLIAFPTVHPRVIKDYRGPVIMAYQQGVEVPCPGGESWRVETGGSVATAALDILIKWGGNPIIFVGQDLAYPGGRTHVEGSVYGDESVAVEKGLMVEGLDGRLVPTSRSLNIYRRWIEQRIAKEQGRRFINATAAGTRIRGAEEKSLTKVKEEILQVEHKELKSMVYFMRKL